MDRSRSVSSWAIVAIPEDRDRVWEISSEKVPHLTVLFLGDQEPGPHLTRITDFLEHTVGSTMTRFGLPVNRRGTLGEDEADVLFFEKNRRIKELENFRSHLLTNEDIFKAYNSAFQYPEWTPHLTLGYPKSPAKPDARNLEEFWVEFNRIALWTGDYEGPTYKLKNYEAEDLSMNDASTAMKQGEALTSDVLAHFGVKGMKWGVRRSRAQLDAAAENHPDSVDVAKAKETAKRIKDSGGKTDSISNQDLQNYVNRMNLEQNYSRLAKDKSTLTKGQKRLNTMLSVGKSINDVMKFLNSPAGKAVRKSLGL